jgi:hypothetical protein
MLPGREKYKEAAHTGEEFFQDKAYELERQCMTVQSAVQRKILSFPEALEAYGVTKEQFANYLVKNIREEMYTTLYTGTGIIDVTMYLEIIKKLVHEAPGSTHSKKIPLVDNAIVQFSNEIEAEDYNHKQVAG